jgi:hypothetical protein
MSLLNSTITNESKGPPRLIIYGERGIGKSSLTKFFPAPVVLDFEDGLTGINVPRFSAYKSSISEVKNFIQALINEPHEYKTLVIDTIDALEMIIQTAVAHRHGAESIGEVNQGFGRGYVIASQEMLNIQKLIKELRDKRKMAVVFLAHEAIVRVSLPDGNDFDKYMIKLDKRFGPVILEWVDAILFVKRDFKVVKSETKTGKATTKAVGGENRIVHTIETNFSAGKNRWELPESFTYDKPEEFWATILPYIKRANQKDK